MATWSWRKARTVSDNISIASNVAHMDFWPTSGYACWESGDGSEDTALRHVSELPIADVVRSESISVQPKLFRLGVIRWNETFPSSTEVSLY